MTMQRLEIKSRVDAKLAEWKRHLDVMRVKLDESEGDAVTTYQEQVAALENEHEELRAEAARIWHAADHDPDVEAEAVEKALDEWAKRATRTRDHLMK